MTGVSGNCLLRFVCLSRFFSVCVCSSFYLRQFFSLPRQICESGTCFDDCDVSAVVMMRLGESPFPLLSLPSFFPLPVCT